MHITASPSTVRLAARSLAALAIVLGIVAERVGDVSWPGLDLAAGWAVAGAALVLASTGRPRTAVALAVAALLWFAGTVEADAAWLHRAALATAVVAAPDLQMAGLRRVAAIAVAWVCASQAVPTEAAALATAVAVVAARPRSAAAVSFAIAVGGVQLVRLAAPGSAEPTLAAYDVLIAIPALLLAGQALLARTRVAEAVVQLGTDAGIRGVEQALAAAVGDPRLRVARWSAAAEAYVDANMTPIDLGDDPERLTSIPRGGAPFAALLHAPGTLADRRLREATERAARLGIENAELQEELDERAATARDSRRRLVETGLRQRSLLARRLESGPGRRLARLAGLVEGLPAVEQRLAGVRHDLDLLAQGLLPGAVGAGDLVAALERLRTDAAVPIALEIRGALDDLPPEVVAAVYFSVVEAVTNVARHAGAEDVVVTISRTDGRVVGEVRDDGSGGADADGSGLQGIADRIVALGGTFELVSSPGKGTRVKVSLPV